LKTVYPIKKKNKLQIKDPFRKGDPVADGALINHKITVKENKQERVTIPFKRNEECFMFCVSKSVPITCGLYLLEYQGFGLCLISFSCTA